MLNIFKKKLSLISFSLIPLLYFWDPSWVTFLGIQPYWPIFWLLPWSILYGSINGFIVGLFLGLTLDSLTIESTFTQIPGLLLCGIWFGKLGSCNNIFIAHFRYGLICSIGSFLCNSIVFSQIFIKNFSDKNLFIYYPSFRNVFAELFITGFLAPLFCSCLFNLFKREKENKKII